MAGETGQNALVDSSMPEPLSSLLPGEEESFPPVIRDLLETPGNYAFVQAMEVIRRYLRSQGIAVDGDTFRFSVNPNLSFPPADIESLRLVRDEDGRTRVEMMMNLLGLHGAGSPLPAYFTEYVAQHQDYPDALRDFFDIFNHRLVRILQATWVKYRYYAQYRQAATDRLSDRFFGFVGVGGQAIRQAKNLNWPRLMAYMGLIAFSGESLGSMESILRHYFAHQDVHVIPCIPRWAPIPEDQQTRLDECNCILGDDFIIGTEAPDQTGKFRIRISNLTWDEFISFLPNLDKFEELQTLTKFVLRSRLDFDVELRLHPDAVRTWQLEEGNSMFLGWATWSGEGGDGVVILETQHGEL